MLGFDPLQPFLLLFRVIFTAPLLPSILIAGAGVLRSRPVAYVGGVGAVKTDVIFGVVAFIEHGVVLAVKGRVRGGTGEHFEGRSSYEVDVSVAFGSCPLEGARLVDNVGFVEPVEFRYRRR